METPKITIKEFRPALWPFWIVIAIGWLISKLPIRGIFGIGKTLGQLFYWASRRRRHITEVNLSLCFPALNAKEHKALTKESFTQVGIGLIELLIPWLNPRRDLTKRFDVYGEENLVSALSENRGVIIVGAHFAALDIAIPVLCSFGPIDCMYRANRNPVWEWLQVKGRKNFFGRVIEREEMKKTIRCLKEGRAIWYGVDQDYGAKHSIFAPFYNIDTATIMATSRLARINDSPVIFLRQYRNIKERSWEIHFSPSLKSFPSGNDYQDALQINRLIEEGINVDPSQYLWMHRRFKTRPKGEKSFY